MVSDSFGQHTFDVGDWQILHGSNGIYLTRDGQTVWIGHDHITECIQGLMRFQHEIVQKNLVCGPRSMTDAEEDESARKALTVWREEAAYRRGIRAQERDSEEECRKDLCFYIRKIDPYGSYATMVEYTSTDWLERQKQMAKYQADGYTIIL